MRPYEKLDMEIVLFENSDVLANNSPPIELPDIP